MKRFNTLFALALLPFLDFSQLISLSDDAYWISVGITGYATPEETFGFSPVADINLLKGSTLYKIRYQYNKESAALTNIPPAMEQFTNLSAMVGKVYSLRFVHFAVSTGVGVTRGVKRGSLIENAPKAKYEEESFITPSLPIEFNILFGRFMNGSDISFFADLNYKIPNYGMGLRFALGKFK